MVDDARDGDDLVPAHDERPRLALRTGDLGVDEHVLDLLRSAGEAIARPPAAYLKAWPRGVNRPPAPANRAFWGAGAGPEPERVVRAHGLEAAAEIETL